MYHDIKIFNCYPKNTEIDTPFFPKNKHPFITPILIGGEERKNPHSILSDQKDCDTGDRYKELSAIYYAWKNIDASYYGICRNNRYMIFDESITDNEAETSLSDDIWEKPYLQAEQISEFMDTCEIAFPHEVNIRWAKLPPACKVNIYEYFCGARSGLISKEILEQMNDIIEINYPEYKLAYEGYLGGTSLIVDNIFVMNRVNFHRYCELLFGVLEKLESTVCTDHFSNVMFQYPTQVGLILLGTFIAAVKLERQQAIKNTAILNVAHTEIPEEVLPAFTQNNVPIVSMSSNYYVPYLSVLIKSVIQNMSDEYNYDFIVLESEITENNKSILLKMVSQYSNFSLRFLNPAGFIDDAQFHVANNNYSKEAYYRLFAPWLMAAYKKIIIMDADIVMNNDLAKLYQVDVDGYCLGAVRDVAYQGILNIRKDKLDYTMYEMNMQSPYDYCNTGVMLLNMDTIRNTYQFSEVFEYSITHKFAIQEQDILNVLYENKIKFLELKWNFYTVTNRGVQNWIDSAPRQEAEYYYQQKEDPYTIHYANVPKPWDDPEIEFANIFWDIAETTPFYHLLLARLAEYKASAKMKNPPRGPAARPVGKPKLGVKGLLLEKILKPIFSPIIPLYSLRREALKEHIKALFRRPNRLPLIHYYMKQRINIWFIKFTAIFPWTENYKEKQKILSYKNKHKGERCFFIGLGPSLKIEDLETLSQKGEVSFAVNNIFPVLEMTDWRPTYYLNQEFIAPKSQFLFDNFQENIGKCDFNMSFFANNKYKKDIKNKVGNAVFLPIQNDWITYYGGKFPMENFGTDCTQSINAAFVSMYTLLQLASYMGFSEIYLIGCDGKYNMNRAHIYEQTENDKLILNSQRAVEIQTQGISRGFVSMHKATETHDFTIKNATRGGYLETFRRVDFDKLFKE